MIALTAVACLGSIFLTHNLSQQLTVGPKNEFANLNQTLGTYKNSVKSKLEEQNTQLLNKLTQFKKLRLRSEVSLVLSLVPRLMPDGTWLKDLRISYEEPQTTRKTTDVSALSVIVTGYAYTENPKEQIRLVNNLVRNMRDHPEFSKFFGNIDLDTVKTQTLNEVLVTFFKINCD